MPESTSESATGAVLGSMKNEDENAGKEFRCNNVARFVVVKTLKHGAWGQTYLAKSDLDSLVVVKEIQAAALGDPSAVERFKREVRFMAALMDPHIVTLITADLEAMSPWYVMEYARDGTLEQWLKDPTASERTPEILMWLLGVIAQIANALRAAHTLDIPIIHRDVKPANILLWRDSRVAKLADFGLAKEMDPDATRLTLPTAAIPGTISYMCAEQQNNDKPAPGWDIYSLGVTLYECVGGRLPRYRATPIEEIACIVSLGREACSMIGQIHTRMMDETPSLRPSAVEVAEALLKCQQAYWRSAVLTGEAKGNPPNEAIEPAHTQRETFHDRLKGMILAGPYRLFFNPARGLPGSKVVRFGQNGKILEGRNNNESSWRIAGDFLEFLDSEGAVFSRFWYNPEEKRFNLVNDPESAVIKKFHSPGQYMIQEERS